MIGRRPRTLTVLALLCAFIVPAAAADTHTPVPYSPDEFPTWAHDLWRAEAIIVGSFPFTLFMTFEVYDTYRYIANDLQPAYAPWPLGSTASLTYTDEETLWIAVSAVSLSVVVATLDFIIEKVHERSEKH